ncbi:MAG: GEVED domain-containing protein [Flavobacterium sp.]|nr:GEVED domain-containing protein [Flavobacterium sp.]
MYKNYNSLSTGRDTCLKNRIGDDVGSPPHTAPSGKFMRNPLWVFLFFFMFASIGAFAQVSINQSFDATGTPTGWTYTGFARSTTTPCTGTASIRKNQWSSNTTADVQTPTWVSNAQDLAISFSYKLLNFSGGTALTNTPDWGTMNVEVSTNGGTSYGITVATISPANHVSSSSCATLNYTVPGASLPNGNTIRVRIRMAYGVSTTPDFYVYLDNVVLTQVSLLPPPCLTLPTTPANASTGKTNGTLTWPIPAGGATGYTLSLGTDGAGATPPTSVYTNQSVGNVTTYTIPNGVLAPSTTYYWQILPSNANGTATGCAIWSFTTAAVPGCPTVPSPADAATNVSRNPTLSWTAGTPASTSYDVYFGTTPVPPLVGNSLTTTYAPTAPLAASTVYYWMVAPKNISGANAGCTVYSFTTGTSLSYCTPVTDFGCGDGDVIARVVLNTLDNNSGTGCPSDPVAGNQGSGQNGPGYSDYTGNLALTTTLQAGSNYNCTVYAGQYSEGYAAWIDYNDDGTFDNVTERIGFSAGQVTGSGVAGQLGSSASFPINVACNPPVGTHRLRVRAMYNINGSVVTPCTNNSYGEVEDYLVTITAAAACPQPFNLSSANVTATTADLTWSVGCVETAWEVAIQPVGSGLPVGSGVASASTTFAATYTAGTSNEYYVRANCGAGSFSNWTGPYVFTAPACTTAIAPTNGETDVVLTAGAYQFSWNASAGATSYDIYFGTTSGALALIGNTAATTIQITGLLPSTQYFWRLDPKNGNGTATGCTEFTFTTLVAYCTPAPTSVDGTGITNVTFSTINNTTVAEAGNFGDYTAQVADVISGTTIPVSISFATGFTYDTKIWVDWNDDKDFNDVGEEVYSGTSDATNPTTLAASFSVTGALGSHRLRIGGVDAGPPTPCWTSSFGSFEDYTINVVAPPPCVAPTAPVATNVTTSGADISWTASVSNPTDGYEYEVRSSGAPGSGATGLGASGSTLAGVVNTTVSGLIAETNYTLYVRSACTTGLDVSNWVSSASFRTGYCVPTYSNGPGTTDQIANVTLGTLNNNSGASTSPYYTFYSALTVPSITEGTTNNVSVTFGSDSSQFAAVWIDFNQNLVFEASEGFVSAVNAGSSGTTVIPVNVPYGVVPGNTRMRVRGGNDTALTTAQACGASSNGFGETEDYIVSLVASVACTGTPDPGNTTTPDDTLCLGTQFTLSTQNATSGSGVTYQWESADDSAFTINVVSLGTLATQQVTMAATSYYRVGVTCSGNTGYSTPLLITLNAANECYCTPVTTYGCADGDVIARVTLNTLDNNSGTGCPSDPNPNDSSTLPNVQGPGYSDYTSSPNPSHTTTLQAGSTYNCTVYAGQYTEGYAAWVDYNDDGIFDNVTEKIGFSAGQVTGSGTVGVLGSSATFQIHLACNPPIGVHRLRVRAMYAVNGSAVTPCDSNSYGEVEDYLITITEPAACPQPSALAAANVTATTADLSWTIGCAETAWEVAVQPAGSGEPAGAGTPVATNSFAATFGAGPQEFYVRADCSGDGYSLWSGPYIFTAPPCPVLAAPADASTNADPGATQLVWTAAPGAVSYDVYLGTTSGALNLLGNIGATTVGINGLLYNTQYFWRIDAINPQGTSAGCTEFSFTTTANVPAFDTCAGAISLDVLTSPQSGSTSGLNSDFEPSCDFGGTPSPDAYYSITVPPYNTLTIGQTVNSYDSIISIFYGSCGALTEISCLDEPDTGVGSQLTWFNNTGTTQTVYYIQDGYSGASGTFTITWNLSAPAPCSLATTWNGSAWDNGYPIATQNAVIAGAYSSVANLSACALTVSSGAVTVNSGHDFNITGAVTVTGGSLTFENNANLIQVNDVDNSGTIKVKRNAVMRRLDYVYWGSPVDGQDLKAFSPYTVSPTNLNGYPTPVGSSRFYTLNEPTNSFQVIAEPIGVSFVEAKGYMLRAPNTFPSNGTQATFNGEFTGTPHNGSVTFPITFSGAGKGFNMLGNPYPSPIDADLFLAQSPGELYFWTHTNQAAVSGANYATYTTFGTAAAAGGATPDGSIAVGQGFLLKTTSSGNATFDNGMRTGNNTATFFRNANTEKHRIWLNLSNSVGLQNQILVGYLDGATSGVDVSVDAKQIESGINNIASIIGDEKFNINARALPFADTDEFPLSFNALEAGSFTIAIDHVDGLFSEDQDVFIKDNISGIIHNVKESGYTFAAEAGTTTNRFSVVFQSSTLNVQDPTFNANNVVIFKNDNVLNINSGGITMSGVKVFDIRGRLIFEQSDINANTAALTNLRAEQEVLLVQITSTDNRVVTKKVVY